MNTITKSKTAQVKAIKLAINELTKARRQFAPGEIAYRHGLRAEKIDNKEITGTVFLFVETDHKKYTEHSEAIRQLEDLIEILEDAA